MAARERAAFMDGKRKELGELFGHAVRELHKPTGDEGPERILKAKWVLTWTKDDDSAPRATARLVLQGINVPDAFDGKVRHHLQRLDWDVSWLCDRHLTTDGDCGRRTWQPHFYNDGRKNE
eukprot:495996-Pyramimonas_sp.AAC.1